MATGPEGGVDHDPVEDVGLLVAQHVLESANALPVGADDVDTRVDVEEGSRLSIVRHEIRPYPPTSEAKLRPPWGSSGGP